MPIKGKKEKYIINYSDTVSNKWQRATCATNMSPSAAITRAKPYDTQYHAVSVVYILRLHNSIAAYKARCLYLPERQMSSKNALAWQQTAMTTPKLTVSLATEFSDPVKRTRSSWTQLIPRGLTVEWCCSWHAKCATAGMTQLVRLRRRAVGGVT